MGAPAALPFCSMHVFTSVLPCGCCLVHASPLAPVAGGGGAMRRRTLEGVGVGARDSVPRLRGAPMHVVDRVRIVVLDVPAER